MYNRLEILLDFALQVLQYRRIPLRPLQFEQVQEPLIFNSIKQQKIYLKSENL